MPSRIERQPTVEGFPEGYVPRSQRTGKASKGRGPMQWLALGLFALAAIMVVVA